MEGRTGTNMTGPTNVQTGANKEEHAEPLRGDVRHCMAANGATRGAMVGCGSTETYIKAGPQHQTIEAFEKAMEENDDAIAPSMLYAYAAIMEGVAYCNGAPNLSADFPAMVELANRPGVAISGKDFKTGQTWMQTVIAPGMKARMPGPQGRTPGDQQPHKTH